MKYNKTFTKIKSIETQRQKESEKKREEKKNAIKNRKIYLIK